MSHDPHQFVSRSTVGAKAVGGMALVSIAKRDPAKDILIVTNTEIAANKGRMASQRT
jgi:hypothetical protein